MSFGMKLSATQNLKQSQSIKLKQSLVQTFRNTIKALSWKAYPPEDEILVIDSLVENFLWKIADQEIQFMMKTIFDEKKIKQMILDEAVLLSMPKKENINSFVYKYIFSTILDEQNNLENQAKIIDEQDKLKPYHEKIFIKAIENRKELEQELKQLKELMKTDLGWSMGALADFRIKNDMLNLVDEDMAKLVETISNILQFLLNTKIKKGDTQDSQVNVLWFLRDKVILNEITEFSSERLLNRFLAGLPSFSVRTESNNRKDLQHRTINVIWEFMLISLGIVSPEMFKL